MTDADSGAELLMKRDLQPSNHVPGRMAESAVVELQPVGLTSEEWGIINVVLYAANDPAQIRQIMQSSEVTSHFGDQEIAQHIVSLGEKLLHKKKFNKAGRLFTAACLIDPHLIEAYTMCAETYVQRNRYEKAIKLLKRAIRINPRNLGLLQFSANLTEFYGDYAHLAYFERLMLKENPQDARTFLNLLQLLTDHANFDQFVKIVESLPLPSMNQRDLFRAYNLLVSGYEEMKQYERALSYAEAALAIKPKRLALWEAKATIYRKLGNNEAALRCLQQMVRIKPHAKKYNEDAYKFGKKHHLL